MSAIVHSFEKFLDLYFACIPRPTPNLISSNKTFLIAHRGAHDKTKSIQENTHQAFQRALDLGCYGIEFDIHATADNIVVVNHDPTLQRLWGHDLAINVVNFKKLHALVPALPTLAEVIALYGKRMHLYIEVKTPFNAISELAEILKDLTPCIDYHLLALDASIFPKLQMFPKQSLLLVPTHHNVRQFCNLSLHEQYGGVLGHYFLMTNHKIQELLTAKQVVGVGFVDSKFSLYRELNRGIQFLFTNNAAVVAAHLQDLQEWSTHP